MNCDWSTAKLVKKTLKVGLERQFFWETKRAKSQNRIRKTILLVIIKRQNIKLIMDTTIAQRQQSLIIIYLFIV